MPGKNISRIEAQERASHLTVHGYEVLLDLTKGETTYYSKTIVEFSSNLIGYDTFIDSVGKKVISAVLNDQPVDVDNYDGESIFLHGLQAENKLIIEMEGLYSATGEGLQRSVDPADNQVYMYTQGAPALSRNIFPNFDQPDLKAPFTLSVVAPTSWQVLSNNPLIEKIAVDSDSSKWSFSKTPPISTYLYALIAGPYFHVEDEYRGKKVVPLGIYIRNSLAEKIDPENIFQITKQGLAFYENLFDIEYPFAKYDQIGVVDYNWGAMENPGAVTFKEDRFVFRSKVTDRQHLDRASVILHEMAHLWFGDMVTMQWWNDLWLNESFAEWIAYFALAESTRFSSSWVSFNADVKNWAYRADQLSSTHSIATDAPDVETGSTNFDGISYAKGASVLKQLCAYLGDELFFAGIRSYFRKFAWKNTTLQDLIDELQSASGKDLSSWGKSWFQSAGVNTIVPELTIENTTYSSLAIKQFPPTVPSGSNDLRTHLVGVGLYDLIDDRIILRKRIELVIQGELTSIPALVGERVADV
ncbi:MAG: aminopeptidase N, partial [Actinomycetes bacterium]